MTNGTDKLIPRLKFSDEMYGSQNIFCEGTSYHVDKVQLVNQSNHNLSSKRITYERGVQR